MSIMPPSRLTPDSSVWASERSVDPEKCWAVDAVIDLTATTAELAAAEALTGRCRISDAWRKKAALAAASRPGRDVPDPVASEGEEAGADSPGALNAPSTASVATPVAGSAEASAEAALTDVG
jgi:hypothetical protein